MYVALWSLSRLSVFKVHVPDSAIFLFEDMNCVKKSLCGMYDSRCFVVIVYNVVAVSVDDISCMICLKKSTFIHRVL